MNSRMSLTSARKTTTFSNEVRIGVSGRSSTKTVDDEGVAFLRRTDRLCNRPSRESASVASLGCQLGIATKLFYEQRKPYAHLGLSEIHRQWQLEEKKCQSKRIVDTLFLEKHMLPKTLQKCSARISSRTNRLVLPQSTG